MNQHQEKERYETMISGLESHIKRQREKLARYETSLKIIANHPEAKGSQLAYEAAATLGIAHDLGLHSSSDDLDDDELRAELEIEADDPSLLAEQHAEYERMV